MLLESKDHPASSHMLIAFGVFQESVPGQQKIFHSVWKYLFIKHLCLEDLLSWFSEVWNDRQSNGFEKNFG